jgi:hypothetical protein
MLIAATFFCVQVPGLVNEEFDDAGQLFQTQVPH